MAALRFVIRALFAGMNDDDTMYCGFVGTLMIRLTG